MRSRGPGTTNPLPADAAIAPVSATAEKIAFATCPLFDELADDTELTFTFEIGGKSAGAGTKVIGA